MDLIRLRITSIKLEIFLNDNVSTERKKHYKVNGGPKQLTENKLV